jgi:hypothetical protein
MVQSHPSKYSPPIGTHRPKRNRLGPHVLRPNLPGHPNSAHIDRSRGCHDCYANAASLSVWPSKLITLPFDKSKINGNSAMKHSTAATTTNTHSSIAHDSVSKLPDSTIQAGTLLALDRPILSLPLTTILGLPATGLEARISEAELSILRCISDANDNHVQSNTIRLLSRRRDG